MRILVTGATGLLGPYLVKALAPLGEVTTLAREGTDVIADLRDYGQVKAVLASVNPDVVVHAAALTDVDLCQRNPAMAKVFNLGMVRHLTELMSDDSRLVLVSSDQVYPDVEGPHVEERTAPVNVYGETKLAGEQSALLRSNSLVVRTNMFGPSLTPGRTSLSDFCGEFRGGKQIKLFSDILFSPLHFKMLRSISRNLFNSNLWGL